MAKKETFLMRFARLNGKLSNDTYKRIIKNSKLVPSSMSIKEFSQAYHSSKTLPEYRAMLLTSIFDKRRDYRQLFKYLSNNKALLSSNFLKLRTSNISGQPAFILTTFDEKKLSIVDLPFNQQMREEVQRWQPSADKNKLLSRALLSGKVHAQKAAFLLADVKTAIYAAADMLITNIKANDPLLLYLIDSDKPSPRELIESMEEEVGSYYNSQSRFLRDINHMANEFSKINPILSKLGLDTGKLEDELEILKGDVSNFVDSVFITKEGEIQGLYDSFKNINNVITEALLLAEDVDNIDLDDKALYSIGRLQVIPTFVDYSPKKLGLHRRAAETSVSTLIKRSLTRFNRNEK